MKLVLNAYRFLNLISIDVACGAMVCASFFAHIFHVQLLVYGISSLGITVWIIYTTDHLLDAGRLKHKASTKRHQFHQWYFGLMCALVVMALLVDAYLILHIRRPVFSWGLGLAALVFMYLVLQRWMSPFKEIVAAVLYSGGVLLPAMSLQTGSISLPEILLVIVFVLTALINLLLFSMFDVEKDIKQTQPSFVILLGERSTRIVIGCLFVVQLLLLIDLIFMTTYVIESIVLMAMNGVLVLLSVFHERLKEEEDYRLVGDVIFLFPLCYLLLTNV
jgi:4-hydroxybenzoate polyprenyltransferase